VFEPCQAIWAAGSSYTKILHCKVHKASSAMNKAKYGKLVRELPKTMRGYVRHLAYQLAVLPFLTPLAGGPFSGPQHNTAIRAYVDSLDLLRTKWLSNDYATWPEAWKKTFKLRKGMTSDVPGSGAHKGATPTWVITAIANGYVLTSARVYDDSHDKDAQGGACAGKAEMMMSSNDQERLIALDAIDLVDDPTDQDVNGDADNIASVRVQDDNTSHGSAGTCDEDDEDTFLCELIDNGAQGDLASPGARIRNPFCVEVDGKVPLARLVMWHARLLPFTGPSIRPCLPQVPDHS